MLTPTNKHLELPYNIWGGGSNIKFPPGLSPAMPLHMAHQNGNEIMKQNQQMPKLPQVLMLFSSCQNNDLY